MAQFVILCTDKPGALPLREATRPEHVAYLKSQDEILMAAGPFLDDEGRMNGSLLIVDVADRGAAEAFAAGDPYAKAGLFAAVEIKAWRWGVKPPQ